MSDESDITLGELVRSVAALVAQVTKLADRIEEFGSETRGQFDRLDDRFTRKDLHVRDVAEINARQEAYQRQTDAMLNGWELEVRSRRATIDKEFADVEARGEVNRIGLERLVNGLRESIDAADTKRAAALEKVATQRHNDRIVIGVAFLTALILPLIVAITSNGWGP